MPKVVGVSSSLKQGSLSRQMVETVLDHCRQEGMQTELIDLAGYTLPLCDGRADADTYGPAVTRLRDKLRAADGLVVGTPVYNASYSGLLKNFIDVMPRDAVAGKLVAFVSASGGFGGDTAMNHLRDVFSTLKAICYPEQTNVSKRDAGLLKNPKIAKRLQETAQGFCKLLKQLRPPGASHSSSGSPGGQAA